MPAVLDALCCTAAALLAVHVVVQLIPTWASNLQSLPSFIQWQRH